MLMSFSVAVESSGTFIAGLGLCLATVYFRVYSSIGQVLKKASIHLSDMLQPRCSFVTRSAASQPRKMNQSDFSLMVE